VVFYIQRDVIANVDIYILVLGLGHATENRRWCIEITLKGGNSRYWNNSVVLIVDEHDYFNSYQSLSPWLSDNDNNQAYSEYKHSLTFRVRAMLP